MNIYEFVELLKRQKWLLAIGGGILILLVAGAWLNVSPKYTATLRLVVVEEGISDLADVGLATSDFFRIASIYGDLLSSVEAQEEIATREGVEIEDLRVTTSDRTSSVELAVDSPTAEGALAGALGGFSWLEERIQRSPEIANTPVDNTTIPPVVVDSNGLTEVDVLLDVEPLYADIDPTLWFEIDTHGGDSFASPLTLLEPGMSFRAVVDTVAGLGVSVGPETGRSFDEVRLPIPDLPENPPPGTSLNLGIKRGAVLFTGDTPTLNPLALSLSWKSPTTVPGEEARVAVLLLNPDLKAIPVGQRRGPIISGAIFVLGVAFLLILATARDGWQRRRDELTVARIGAKSATRESA